MTNFSPIFSPDLPHLPDLPAKRTQGGHRDGRVSSPFPLTSPGCLAVFPTGKRRTGHGELESSLVWRQQGSVKVSGSMAAALATAQQAQEPKTPSSSTSIDIYKCLHIGDTSAWCTSPQTSSAPKEANPYRCGCDAVCELVCGSHVHESADSRLGYTQHLIPCV